MVPSKENLPGREKLADDTIDEFHAHEALDRTAMNDLESAAQLALEALEWMSDCYAHEDDETGECASCHERSYKPHADDCKKDRAIKALRAALGKRGVPTCPAN